MTTAKVALTRVVVVVPVLLVFLMQKSESVSSDYSHRHATHVIQQSVIELVYAVVPIHVTTTDAHYAPHGDLLTDSMLSTQMLCDVATT